ncbi:hypothetical protein GCM10022421_32330 [Oceanisphaera sediminis]|uniref:Outer membrane protein assembly factor BamE domain-containing protein n=1 Tax=Oceanisphaera sediminis TaxID=981381 RepID=A0ABP7ESP5_9GAMM
MNRWQLITLAASAWLLAGCAGNQINYNQASSYLELGMKKQQVRQAIGDPRRTDVNQDRERWVYWNPVMIGFVRMDNEVMASDRLVVTFKDNVVTQWGNQTFQADAMEMNSKIMEGVYSQPRQQTQPAN